MKAGDAKGVPVQMKWLNASEVWKPAPRLKIESPWSRTIVGLVSELLARAVAGKTETISIAAMTIMSRSNRGLAEPRAGRWACRANEAFIQKPSRGPIESRL